MRELVWSYLVQCEDLSQTTAAGAAKAAGVTEGAMRRQLKRTGMSFEELRTRDRARRVFDCLKRDPNTPVEELAAAAGYAHDSTFTRAFKSWIGESVTQYRRRLLNNERRKYRERNVHNTPSRARIHAERRPGVANRVRSKTQSHAVS